MVFLKAVLRRASGRGQRVDDRIFGIPPNRHTPREGIALTPELLQLLADALPEHIRRLVLIAGSVGARASELYALEEGQLDLDARPDPLLHIPRATLGNKSRKEKAIPLTQRERTLFREQLLARARHTRLLFPAAEREGVHRQWVRARRLVSDAASCGGRMARRA